MNIVLNKKTLKTLKKLVKVTMQMLIHNENLDEIKYLKGVMKLSRDILREYNVKFQTNYKIADLLKN